jgi:hypothetical protein
MSSGAREMRGHERGWTRYQHHAEQRQAVELKKLAAN